MIIGISGKKQSGKDTVANIIQYIIHQYTVHGQLFETFDEFTALKYDEDAFEWKKKQFAGKLKEIVCLLIGCTMKQLEDNNFKEKELGEEWWYYKDEKFPLNLLPYTKEYTKENEMYKYGFNLIKLTPRLLLQLLGTDCGRNIIHPNIWVNATMADYKTLSKQIQKKVEGRRVYEGFKPTSKYKVPDSSNIPKEHHGKILNSRYFTWYEENEGDTYPDWLITDVRFPNELKAIEDRDGVVIRVNRNWAGKVSDNHPSETALDTHQFKYTINNDGNMIELIEMVQNILIQLKII
jgi:hypothetical protein